MKAFPFLLTILAFFRLAIADDPLPPFGAPAALLTPEPDRSALMVAGIDRALDRLTAGSVAKRSEFWHRDFASPQAYEKSVAPNRERLRHILGAVDAQVSPVRLEYIGANANDRTALLAESTRVRVFAVRWTVLDGVTAEGLLLQPVKDPVAQIIALPDADQSPEMLVGFAQKLAETGCEILIPALIDRQCTWSGNPDLVMTDQTHREWIWRPAFELGRHIIGFEVQKVLSAVDWFRSQGGSQPIGVAGYGEGGLIALSAATLDPRISAALVSGYFQPREALWSEPVYRNAWGLLREFGDAEIASLIAPRALVIEAGKGPQVDGPPHADSSRRKCAAPGRIQDPDTAAVSREVDRARSLCKTIGKIDLVPNSASAKAAEPFGSGEACDTFLARLGVKSRVTTNAEPALSIMARDPAARQKRQVDELIDYCRRLLRRSESRRANFWQDAVPMSAKTWPQSTQQLRERCWNESFGRLPDPSLPANPRVRKMEERAEYAMWEVVLDVWPDVFAWGYLLVPKDLKPGERRPVVVCQHGLEGLPSSVIEEDEKSRDWRYYKAFARQLAARGFVCFCPHNPYRDAYRQLQRKANPLGLTLFSFILGQHQRELEWLGSLPFVDAKRIGFYGLSYGGVSAVRVPALLEDYALSICSAAFNDWPRKMISTDFRSAYVFTDASEMFSFNLANTFSNAELAALIAPRPFMVERGHNDGVAPDEWVAHEYAKVDRLYAQLGIPERTRIEFFDGVHEIHGVGTFEFLHRHLDWPAPSQSPFRSPR